ncbi:uncharacterized protein TNCV_4210671 [Trichonephila clavipes]|nr:uncharacterized protein TNCV_4210671 [Trichonephila clavipes]
MSSAEYSTRPVNRSRWSLSFLAWSQTRQASLVATPSQWRYTPQRSCPEVKRNRETASALSRCLRIGPNVARVSHDLQKLFVFWVMTVYLSKCVEMMIFALLSVKGDFRLS